MARKKKIDPQHLLKMINEGEEQKSILAKFGFKNSTQLKVAYANALMETGQAPEIKTRRKADQDEKPEKTTSINKRGSLTVPKELIAEMGFQEGEEFEIRKTKAGISLKRITE